MKVPGAFLQYVLWHLKHTSTHNLCISALYFQSAYAFNTAFNRSTTNLTAFYLKNASHARVTMTAFREILRDKTTAKWCQHSVFRNDQE